MSQKKGKPNRLIHETSPYLLQHAYNPVDWYPWGGDALNKAKDENKVILLSVGYSACHWCHVMERESFEDEQTAQLMNDNFVCIKVDREERPDIDKVYQTAHQYLTQRAGGWPLTVFLTPDEHTPLYAGTYFPDKARHGMASFSMVLNRIAEHYQNVRSNIAEHNRVMKETFAKLSRLQSADHKITDEQSLLSNAVQELSRQYDPVYGGFGRAPKFPHSTQIDLLLAYSNRESANKQLQERCLTMAFHTLDAMADGGLNDQVGGGFCRYSVDDRWEIPHFEKMLYDNALLLPLYVDAGFYPEQEHMVERAVQTAEWVLREMQSPTGGYYSALDADSEGKEGKFYVWSLDDLQKILSAEEYKAVEIRYGLRGVPNFEGEWHLRVANTLSTVSIRSGFSLDQVNSLLDTARKKLFDERSDRIRPGLDDKILASWNGMMIKAMARAGRLLARPDFVDSAERALDFVRQYMWKDKRLLATAKDTRAHLNSYLDDHVFLVDGILELLNSRWRDVDLAFALDLVDVLLNHYQSEQGCFNFTSDDHETLLYRSIPTHDEATPSGNGIAVQILYKLAYLVGDARYERAANQIISALQTQVSNFPSSFGSLVCGMEQSLFPSTWVVIRGEQNEIKNWAHACVETAPISTLIYPIPNDAVYLPGLLAEKKPADGTVAYVCHATSCAPPCHSLEDLLKQIST